MIVKCKATSSDKTDCPMIRYCLARLSDRTITGCGVPLAYAGVIKSQDVMVEHTVRGENDEDWDIFYAWCKNGW